MGDGFCSSECGCSSDPGAEGARALGLLLLLLLPDSPLLPLPLLLPLLLPLPATREEGCASVCPIIVCLPSAAPAPASAAAAASCSSSSISRTRALTFPNSVGESSKLASIRKHSVRTSCRFRRSEDRSSFMTRSITLSSTSWLICRRFRSLRVFSCRRYIWRKRRAEIWSSRLDEGVCSTNTAREYWLLF